MNCDFIAPWYRWLEYLTFGTALQRRRLKYLDDMADARQVLVLGDGDGRFTAEFLKRNRAARVDAVDISAGMMGLAERRIRRAGGTERVRLYVADARTVELPGYYDLVVTHYFLDCFTTTEVNRLVERVSGAAGRGVRWVVSEFQVPQGGLRRVAAAFLIRLMYAMFRVLTGLRTNRLPEYAGALEAKGFRRVRSGTGWGGLLVSELWERS